MVVKDFLFEREKTERNIWQYDMVVFVVKFVLFTVNLLAIYLAGDFPVLKEVLYQR